MALKWIKIGNLKGPTGPAGDAVAVEKLDSIEKRMPYETSNDGLLAAFVDAAGRQTWLGARLSDGGPTAWAMELLRRRLGMDETTGNPDILFSVTDANNRMTDLTVRSTDGRFTDWVVDGLAPRIAQRIGGSGQVVNSDKYLRDGELMPMVTDMSRASGWGSSSMEGLGSTLNAAMSPLGARFQGEGRRGEQSSQTAARLGSTPALLTFPGNSIPASGPVTVTASIPGYSLKTFTGTVAGVRGELSYASPSFTFTRSTAGSAVSVSAGVSFIPEVGTQHRDAIALLWMGKNDAGEVDDGREVGIIARTDKAFDWLAPQTKRALVLAHFMDTGTAADSIERKQIMAVNAAHQARYGDLFVDVHELLTSDAIWAATGITPTAQDRTEQALGNKPPSLSADAAHLNAAGYTAISNLIIARMVSLGWYRN